MSLITVESNISPKATALIFNIKNIKGKAKGKARILKMVVLLLDFIDNREMKLNKILTPKLPKAIEAT